MCVCVCVCVCVFERERERGGERERERERERGRERERERERESWVGWGVGGLVASSQIWIIANWSCLTLFSPGLSSLVFFQIDKFCILLVYHDHDSVAVSPTRCHAYAQRLTASCHVIVFELRFCQLHNSIQEPGPTLEMSCLNKEIRLELQFREVIYRHANRFFMCCGEMH